MKFFHFFSNISFFSIFQKNFHFFPHFSGLPGGCLGGCPGGWPGVDIKKPQKIEYEEKSGTNKSNLEKFIPRSHSINYLKRSFKNLIIKANIKKSIFLFIFSFYL